MTRIQPLAPPYDPRIQEDFDKLEELEAIVRRGPDAFRAEESLLVRMADELHDTSRISDPTWENARAIFSEEQLLEIVMLCGLYRAVSYIVNATGVALEPMARRF